MGGNGGKPKPGGAQSIKGKGMGGATQVQPAFASVTSVTPGEIAVSLEGTSAADGIALGLDGDAQAATPNAPTTTNNAPVRLNTFDILDPISDLAVASYPTRPRSVQNSSVASSRCSYRKQAKRVLDHWISCRTDSAVRGNYATVPNSQGSGRSIHLRLNLHQR